MKKILQKGLSFLKPFSKKNWSLILFINFLLATLGSCLLSKTTKKDPSKPLYIRTKMYFKQPSTKLTLLIGLTFPHNPKEGPKPLSILDENKKIIVRNALLLAQINNKEQALPLENTEARYLVEVPTKSLEALTPHLGKKMWGLPYIQKPPADKKKETQNKKRKSYEISF